MKASQSPYRDIEVIPTGFSSLDKILGVGGIPLRKITEISGTNGIGKSTLASSIIKQAQKLGMDTCLVDVEFSLEFIYAAALGVDLDKLDLIEGFECAEDFLDATEEWIRAHKKGVIVVDSIGGLVPKAEVEKGAEGKVIGGQAGLIARFCRKVVPQLAINNIALVVLNHEFNDFMNHNKLMTSGGAKLAYHKSVWLRLSNANKRVMQGETQVGVVVKAEIRKNKLASTMLQSCELTSIFGQGFSAEADLLTELLDSGEITKKGNTYFRNGEKLGVGLAKAREALKSV